MLIDLSHPEDAPVTFAEEAEIEPGRLDPGTVAGTIAARLQGTLRAGERGWVVEGELEAAGELICSRCLEPMPWRVDEAFAIVLARPEEAPDGEEVELGESELDVVFVTGDGIKVADLAAEQVLLALPMRPLCSPDCAGLCPRCGANRNRPGACRCEPERDPRWDALREIRDQSS